MAESIVVKSVIGVISAVQETQQSDVKDFASEFHAGSNWIKHAFESCKRKIIESNGIEDECNKRRKGTSAAAPTVKKAPSDRDVQRVDKENSHPNVAINESSSNLPVKKEVTFSKYEEKENEATNIDVMALKVAELRTHLRERGLNTTGLKKVLQDRLQKALYDKSAPNDGEDKKEFGISSTEKKIRDEESIKEVDREEITVDGNKAHEANVQSIELKKSTASTPSTVDAEMEDCSDEYKEQHKEIEKNDKEPVEDEDIEMVGPNSDIIIKQESVGDDIKDEVEYKHSQKKTFGQKLLKATRKVFSPNKIKNSPTKTKKLQSPDGAYTVNKNKSDSCDDPTSTKPVQEQNRVTHEEPDQPSSNSKSLSAQNEDSKQKHSKRASMACNMTVEEIKNAEMKRTEKESSSLDQKEKMVKTIQSTPALSKINYSSSSSQKLRSMKEARKARLDEIRNKVHSNSKTLTQLTSGKTAVASTASAQKLLGKDTADRKRAIALQMRQKAAAAAAKQNTSSTVKSDSAATKQPQSPPTPDKPEPQQLYEQKKQTVQPLEKKALSPKETYEMSDRGESDSDDSEYSDRAPKKKIPKWAQRENLRAALEKQFLDGPGKIDPDEIFPEVSTCDLEAIFDQRKKRYLKRTSSGNWTKDKVTITEKLVYKRNMGFKK